jgi:hypothetical protein
VVLAASEAAAEAAEADEAVPRLPDVTLELVSGKKRQNKHVRYLIKFGVGKKMWGEQRMKEERGFVEYWRLFF